MVANLVDAQALDLFYALSQITSVLSERPLKSADQKTERGRLLNPEYNMDRDQPTSQASPLRINTLLSAASFCGIVTRRSPFLMFADKFHFSNSPVHFRGIIKTEFL